MAVEGGSFNSHVCVLTRPSKLKLLHRAFLNMYFFLFLLLKCYFPGTNCLCSPIFFIFLIFWCSYFCVIHRLLNLLLKVSQTTFPSSVNLWWVIILIVVYNPSLKNPGPKKCVFGSSHSTKHSPLEP